MGKVAKFIIGGVILGALSVATFGVGGGLFGSLVTKIGAAASIGTVAAGAIAGGIYGAGLGIVNLLKPKLPGVSSEFGRELQLNGDPLAVRKIVYGEAWTAGTLRFRGATGTDNEDLYLVIVLAGHEIESVEEVEFEDETLTLDGSGDCTSPARFAGNVNVRFMLGADDQLADATLVSTFTEWTTDHRLRGLAYAIVRLTFDETDLNSIPRMLFRIRGRKVYDPRLDSTNGGTGTHRVDDESTWEWSDNLNLCANDFIMGPQIGGKCIAGLNVAPTRISWPNLIAEANVSDEAVALDAGGTQPRYTANGVIDPRQDHGTNIRHFEVTMAGDITLSDGLWRQFAGAYRAPTLHLQDQHFIGPIRHIVHKGESKRVDTAQGVYASASQNGEVLDYPPVRLASATVGSERVMNLDLALVNNAPQAQRCAKIALEREAAGKTIHATTSLYGYRSVPGETVNMTHAAFGLSTQAMRVIDVQLSTVQLDDNRIGLSVDVTLEAGPASLYSWDAEETAIGSPADIPQAQVPFPSTLDGDDGISVFHATVYRRSATAPATPTGGSYNFGTGVLTPPSSWSTSPPAGSDPLYVSVAQFSVIGQTGVDSSTTWTSPALFVQDGADGSPGSDGSDGSDGADGLSVHVATVYRRSASAPSTPTGGSYNFGTGALTPPTNWSATPPEGSAPLYVSLASFSVVGQTGVDSSTTWTTPNIVVEEAPIPFVADPLIRRGSAHWDLSDAQASYSTGDGIDGTDLIDLQPTSSSAFFWTAARRGPDSWDPQAFDGMAIEIRWRARLVATSGTWSQQIQARVRVTDDDEGNQTVYFGYGDKTYSQADTLNVWHEESAVVVITAAGGSPRYIQIGLFLNDNVLSPDFEVDFLDASIAPRQFGGQDKAGLVPAPSSPSGQILSDSGDWVDQDPVALQFLGIGALTTITNQASALQFFQTNSRLVAKIDLSSCTQVRMVMQVVTISASGNTPRVILRYHTSHSTNQNDYSQIGDSSEVQISLAVAGYIDTGWIDLAAGAIADNRYVALLMQGGNAVADPQVSTCIAYFK